jgi:hypothetical protein
MHQWRRPTFSELRWRRSCQRIQDSWKLCRAAWNVVCLSHQCRHCWNAPPTASLCSHPLFGLRKRSASVDECQRGPIFFSLGGIQWHTSASYAIPCQMPFCYNAPLLLSVTRQQNLTNHCENSTSTAISLASVSNIMGQHNNIGGITFRTLFVRGYCDIFCRRATKQEPDKDFARLVRIGLKHNQITTFLRKRNYQALRSATFLAVIRIPLL